jgi:hypothetical protein
LEAGVHPAVAVDVHPAVAVDEVEVNQKNNQNTYVESNWFAWVFL